MYHTIEWDQAEIAYRQERIGRSFRRSRRAERRAAESNPSNQKPTRRNVRLAA